MPTNTVLDQRLVQKVLAGHTDAYRVLLERHYRTLYAAALAYSPLESDDLLQETCVKAFESLHTLKNPASFLPWAVSILRRTALDAKRKESRRRNLLQHAPTMSEDTVPRPEEEEIRAFVREELAGLDEQHRVVLLLRYYAGKPVAEIAGLLEIRPNAAAKRLQRAREALGERLMQRLTGSEDADVKRHRLSGIMAAVAVADPEWIAHRAAGAAPAAAGMSIVAKILTASAAVGVVAVATMTFVSKDKSEAHVNNASAAPPGPQAIETNSDNFQVQSGDDRSTQSILGSADFDSENAALGATLTVSVRDRDSGARIPNAEVLVAPDRKIDGVERTTILSDADGFAVMGPLPEGGYSVYLTDAPGYFVEAQQFKNQLAVSQDSPDVAIEYLVSKGVSLSGFVFDTYERPIEGAELQAHILDRPETSRSKSGVDGSFTLFGLAETDTLMVQPVKEGYALSPQGPYTLTKAGLRDVILLMHPAAEVSGTLIDSNGDPLPGYRMSMHAAGIRNYQQWSGILDDKTDANGQFTVGGLWPDSYRFTLGLPHSGSSRTVPGSETVNVESGDTKRGFVVVYEQGDRMHIAGRVVDAAGNPIRRATVTMDYQWGSNHDHTGDDGAFRFDRLADKTHTLYVFHDGFTSVDLKSVQAGRDDLVIRMEARGAVSGQVVDAVTGAPITRFSLLERSRQYVGSIDDVTIQFSDPDGRFLLEKVQAGARKVIVNAEGYRPAILENLVIPPGRIMDGVVVKMDPSPVVAGVVLTENGAPAADAYVFQRHEEPTFAQAAEASALAHPVAAKFYQLTDALGRFRLDSVDAKSRFVSAYHPLHGFAFLPVDPESFETQSLEIRLNPPGVVHGVLEIHGQPIPNVKIEAQAIMWAAHAYTDESGYYRIAVPPGAEVSITPRDVPQTNRFMSVSQVSTDSSEAVPVNFDFTPDDTQVSGVVTLDDLPPGAEYRVRVVASYQLPGHRELHVNANCDPQGRYTLDGAPPGTARLQVAVTPKNGDGAFYPEQYVEIQTGEENILNFDLDLAVLSNSPH